MDKSYCKIIKELIKELFKNYKKKSFHYQFLNKII